MSTKGDALMWSQMDDASGLQLLAEASDREVLDLVRRLARAATFTRGGVVEPVDVDLQRLRGRIWEVQHGFSCPDDAMDHSWRDHPWEDAEHQKEAEEEADAIIGTLGAERLLALRRHSAAVAAWADRSWTPSSRAAPTEGRTGMSEPHDVRGHFPYHEYPHPDDHSHPAHTLDLDSPETRATIERVLMEVGVEAPAFTTACPAPQEVVTAAFLAALREQDTPPAAPLDVADGSLVDTARRYVVEVFGADVLDALIEQHRPKGGPG